MINPEKIRRAVAPLTRVVATPNKGKENSFSLGVAYGSACLIDVCERDGKTRGLWLTAKHVLENSVWALLNFFDGDGCAPRQTPAGALVFSNERDLVALDAAFPAPRDVAEPLVVSGRNVKLGEWGYIAGWGSSAKGDRFALQSGQALDLRYGCLAKEPAPDSAWTALARHCVGFNGLLRPGDSGGAALDAETGELTGIALGQFDAFVDIRGFSSNVGICLDFKDSRDFIEGARRLFRQGGAK